MLKRFFLHESAFEHCMTIDMVWACLVSIRELNFQASSSSSTGWTGAGTGTVVVEQIESNVLVQSESGTWMPNDGISLAFSNVYRWTRQPERLRLEHLRFGADRPVYLFDLAIKEESKMATVDPHF